MCFFTMKFAKFLGTPFLTKPLRWLFLFRQGGDKKSSLSENSVKDILRKNTLNFTVPFNR